MNKFNLFSVRICKNKKYKNLKKRYNIYPNLVNRNFKIKKENSTWFTDITYLKYNQEWRFLSPIMDGKTKNIVAYNFGKCNNWNLVEKTLKKAIKKVPVRSDLILHSDQGTQYTSNKYRDFCRKNNITISMSRKGNPWDNAIIENFFSSLKKEVTYNQSFKSMNHYLNAIKEWIKFYNTDRVRFTKF